MKKQPLRLIATIMIVLETVCLFTPFCFQIVYDSWNTRGSKSTRYNSSEGVNIFEVGRKTYGSDALRLILAITLVTFLVLSFVSFLLALLKKKNILTKLSWLTPILSAVALIAFTVFACVTEEIYSWQSDKNIFGEWMHTWKIDWLFYFVVFLHIAVIVIAILLKSKKIEDTSDDIPKTKNKKSESDTTDDLIKYKDLLDKGVITQEEFDAKKKQLLGL